MSEAPTPRIKWNTPRMALTVVLGAINGVITMPIGVAWGLLNNAFGPIGASFLSPFGIFPSMAAYLVPLPGVFMLSYVISGFASLLVGEPSGVLNVYWGLSAGLVGELAGLIFRWNPKRRVAIIILAGLLYIPATNIVTYFAFGWQPGIALWIGLVIALIAFTVESSLLGIVLARWLVKTGLLRTIGNVGSEGE